MVHCSQFGYLKHYMNMDKIKLKPRARHAASLNDSKATSETGLHRNIQRHAADSVDDSAVVYTTRFYDLEQAFATGIPAGYEFLGTGVAFMTNTHKRVHTVDFRNTNLDEDAEGATIEVPYDADTTIAQVKEDLANMVATMSAKTSDDVGLDPSAILGAYAEEGYAGSFENAIDLFEAQGLKLTRKGNTLVYHGQVSFAGGTAQVDVRLYGKRSDATGSLRDAHVTSMSLLARVISAPEFPAGWVIARFENSYHPSTMPRAMQVLASRVSRLLKSSFETEDALATALERCFWGKAAPIITDEQRRQAKEFAESVFGRGVGDSSTGADSRPRLKRSHVVKDAYSQLSYAAMADAFDKYGISYELVDHILWASTPLWVDPVSKTKYILTFCVDPVLSEAEADALYDDVGLDAYYEMMEAASIDLVIERADAGPGGPDPKNRYPDAFSPVSLSSFLNYFNGKRDYLSHLGSLEKVAIELSVMIDEFK